MRLKKLLAITIILLTCFSLFSANSMRIIPLSSSIYDDMDILYQINGLSSPSNARPWSERESKLILSKVDKQTLPSKMMQLYERIESIINENLDIAYDSHSSGSFNLELSTEGYLHSNTDDYKGEDDWVYSFEERKPFVKLEIEYAHTDWIYLYADLQYSKNRHIASNKSYRFNELFPSEDGRGGLGAVIPPYSDGNYNGKMTFESENYSKAFNNNFAFNFIQLENEWPKRAFLSLGGEFWTVQTGRDKIKWGNGRSGNFIIDSHTDFNDYLRASVFSENYKFDYVVLAYNSNYETKNVTPNETFKLLLAHRFEFRLWDKATLAISENLAYQSDVLQFKYLNPADFFHNLNDRAVFNAIAHVELDVAFPLGFRGYFQFVMDQLQAPGEGGDQANCMGYLGGVNYTTIFDNSHILSLNAEAAYTDTLLYRRDEVDFINLRKSFSQGTNRLGEVLIPEYIGYKYGGDAIVFQLDGKYDIPSFGSLRAQFFYMKHGKMNFFVSHNEDGINKDFPNILDKAPSGNPEEIETTFIYTLGFDFTVPLNLSFIDMTFYSDLSYISQHNKLVFNPGGTNEKIMTHLSGWTNDLQFTFGMSVRI